MKVLDEIQTSQITGGGMESWMRYGTPAEQQLLCSNLYGFLISQDIYFYEIVQNEYWYDAYVFCGLDGDL